MRLGLGLGLGAARNAFSPAALFAAGEVGAWYDPSDLTTMFQDSAGTIPVTAVGQPVGLRLDKSGRGNHAAQSTPGSRAILRQVNGRYCLQYDGLDDFYVTSAINFSATDKMTVFAGVRKLSDAAQGIVAELNNGGTNRFSIFAPPSGLTGYVGSSGGSTVVFTPGTTEPAPHSAVLTLRGDISGDLAELRVNSTTIKQVTTDQGTGNYANAVMHIGRRGGATLPFNGYEFGLIVRGAATSATQIASTEAWLNTRTGAY